MGQKKFIKIFKILNKIAQNENEFNQLVSFFWELADRKIIKGLV